MAECFSPYMVRDKKNNTQVLVPCGRCAHCTSRRISQWSFRLMQQDKVSQSAHFITLTYANQHVPISSNGFPSLRKRDVQLFFKRLRKGSTGNIKYYVCGEYGGKTDRPHYHAIIFNADVAKIGASWQLGHCHYGNVTGASVGYTLKYMSKGPWRPKHERDDRAPQFSLMSKDWAKIISHLQ